MAKRPIQGSQRQNELDINQNTPDVRPLHRRFIDWLTIPVNLVVSIMVLAAAAWWVKEVSGWLFLMSAILMLWGLARDESAPLKMPIQEKILDQNQLGPTGQPGIGQGIFYLGNDIKNGKEAWLTNSDCRQHFLVLGTTGAGKSLPLDAKVHTPTGWKSMGDLKIGNLVTTPDGRSAPVIGYYPQGKRSICRLTFDDGRVAEADADHLWQIHHKHWSGKYKAGVSRAGMASPRILTTEELSKAMSRNSGSFYVPLSAPVEKPMADLPIDPYLLGALIGDGNFSNNVIRFSSTDDELLEMVDKILPEGMELHQYSYNSHCDYNVRFKANARKRISELRLNLEKLGLYGCNSEQKFIPDLYKNASISQRWALIQGLMDTDGTCDSRKPALSFSTVSERLAHDVQEVVWSLGGIAKISPSTRKKYTYNGLNKLGKPSFRIHIRHPEPANFFALSRKLSLAEKPYQYSGRLKLKVSKVEFGVREFESACIMVDHPDHLFITNNYVVTHNTESLLGFAANALTWGSGFLFCDGKGDVALFAKVYAMARRFGREDDLLILNFMNGNEDVSAGGGKLRSNTMNPFATGSSDGLTQMVVSLMDDTGGDGAMWKGRATAMLTGLMRALCFLRDRGLLDLNVGTIREHMNLKEIIGLADEAKYPDLPAQIRKSIRSYLTSLPGYQEDKKEKQAQTTLDQHGYLEMQFTKILGNLADVYGHIFGTPYGEVDMHDVVLNRRILVIMLPALEKAKEEIANLGKIVVANLKGMMGGTLGNKLEGSWFEVVENRPTNSPSPFLCILDEVGYYTVDGMALMAAQARSLGFSMVYASQDIPAMKKLNEKEAASIIANTNTKIFMRTEEVNETGKLAVDTGGKALRAKISGYERHNSELSGVSYNFQENAGFEMSDRIDFLDIKSQGEGEMHVLFQDKIARLRGFYANPEGAVDKNKLKLRANHFIRVAKPTQSDIELSDLAPRLAQNFCDPELPNRLQAEIAQAFARLDEAIDEGDEIAIAAKTITAALQNKRPLIEASCAAVAHVTLPLRGMATGFAGDIHNAYEEPMAVPPARGFDLEDFEGRDRNRGRLVAQNSPYDDDDDQYGRPVGVPMADREPPHVPPRRQYPPAQPKKPSRVDPNVKHGVSVNDGSIIDYADQISTNTMIMNTLAALDFVDDMATPNDVEAKIQQALGGPRSNGEKTDTNQISKQVAEFDRAAASVKMQPVQKKPARDDLPPLDDEDGEGSGSGELVSQFLEGLLGNED